MERLDVGRILYLLYYQHSFMTVLLRLILINLGFPRNVLVVINFLVVISFHVITNYHVASYYRDVSQHG